MVESEQPAFCLQSEASVQFISEELRFAPVVGEKDEVALIRGCTQEERVVSELIWARKLEQEDEMFVGINVKLV